MLRKLWSQYLMYVVSFTVAGQLLWATISFTPGRESHERCALARGESRAPANGSSIEK